MRFCPPTYWLVFLSLFFCAGPMQAQDYISIVQHFGIPEGLPHREVKSVFQGHRGFMWLTTAAGLCRFDGYTFKPVKTDKPGIDFSNAQIVAQDSAGWMWLKIPGNSLNIVLFQSQQALVATFEERFGGQAPFRLDEVDPDFCPGPDGSVWFSLKNQSTLVWYKASQGWHKIALKKLGHLNLITATSRGTFWCKTENHSIVEINREGQVLRQYAQPGEIFVRYPQRFSAEGFCYSTGKGAAQRLFAVDSEGVQRELPITPFLLTGHLLPDMLWPFGESGAIWANNRLIDPRHGVLIDLSDQIQTYLNFGVLAFFVDSEHRIWVGTEQGVWQVEIQKNRFKRYFFQPAGKPNPSASCRGILKIGGELCVNFEKQGVGCCDLADVGETRRMNWEKKNTTRNYALMADRSGNIWAGQGGQLCALRGPKGDRRTWNLPNNTDALSIWEAGDGVLWIGTNMGLYQLLPGADSVRPYPGYGRFQELAGTTILHIGPGRDGRVWVCAGTGFYQIDPQNGVQARYWNGSTDRRYFIPAINIQHFYEDADGVFWLASAENGLVRWAPGTQASQTFGRAEGLSSDNIFAVYEDENQCLWLSTDKGIVQFHKKTLRCQLWGEEDGTTNEEFNPGSHFQDPDGRIYFGGVNGVTVISPQEFDADKREPRPPVQITNFHLYSPWKNELIDQTNELVRSEKIELRAGMWAELDFALLDYENMEGVRYACMIEGLDSSWHYLEGHNFRLENLPSGNYRLHIKGQCDNGEWSPRELLLNLTVAAPFYAKTWFWILLIFFLFLATWLGLIVRRRRARTVPIPPQAPPALAPLSKVASLPALQIAQESSPELPFGGRPDMTETELNWLIKLEESVHKHVSDHDFNLEMLGEAMSVSSRHLRRRLKSLTGLTATEYLHEIRLQLARALLESGSIHTVKETAAAVGMRDTKYFSQEYKKRFGELPSKLLIG